MKTYTVDLTTGFERVESDSRTLEIECAKVVPQGEKIFVERPWKEIGIHDHYGRIVRSIYMKDPPLRITRWMGGEREVLYYLDICKVVEWNPMEVKLEDLEVDLIVLKSGIVKLLDVDELVASYKEGRISLADFSQVLFHLETLVNGFFADVWGEMRRLVSPFEEMMDGVG